MRSEGRIAYDQLAEELSEPTATLEDFEPAFIQRARDYADQAHRAWPPRPQTSGWRVTITPIR